MKSSPTRTKNSTKVAKLTTAMLAITLTFSSLNVSARCVRVVDGAAAGICYNEYGQVEDNTMLMGGMLSALVGASSNKVVKHAPVEIDPTDNVNPPYEGTRNFLFQKSSGCQNLALANSKFSATIEPLRSGKVHLMVNQIQNDGQTGQLYDGLISRIGNDVGFSSNGTNVLILSDALYVEHTDENNVLQCKGIESKTQAKATINGILSIVGAFRNR